MNRSPAPRSAETSWPEIWSAVRDRLRLELGQGAFDTWIGPLSFTGSQDGLVHLSAPRRLIRDYVTSHHATRIERAFAALTPQFSGFDIGVSTPENRQTIVRTPAMAARTAAPLTAITGHGGSLSGLWDRELDPTQNFESFVTGPTNEFAFKVAQRFAETDASEFGLLFMHGGFGNGKTHLLNAIALDRRSQGARVLFLRAEDFMRRFLGALRSQETLAFKEELRGADILLIDDLQHICGRAATISEFLHTVNAFTDLKRKVAIAADRSPSVLEGLSEDVRSRLTGAVGIALDKPNAPTRLAILRARATEIEKRRPRAALPDEVLVHIANTVDASPRELIGLLVKLGTYADLTGKPVTMEVAEEALGSRQMSGGARLTIEEIQRKTAEFYKLDLRDLHSPRRARRVARPRQVAMYLSRELTSRSLPDIGRRFGGRDHTTVLHACRRIEELCKTDPLFQQEVDFLRKVLGRAATH